MSQENDSSKEINVVYRQSQSFRNILGSGAYGGLTPTGEIYMGIYTQRLHMPQSSTIQLDSNVGIAKEGNFVVEKGLVRDVEVGVILDVATAQSLLEWLTIKLADAEKRQKMVAERMSGKGPK